MVSKIISFFKKKEELYEIIAICKCKTNIKRNQPSEERHGYMEGAGQLFNECYKNIKSQIFLLKFL
jgi:hypothetical protein